MSDKTTKGWIEEQRSALARFETEKDGAKATSIDKMTASELSWELKRAQQHLDMVKNRLKQKHPHVYADLGYCECEHVCNGCRDK